MCLNKLKREFYFKSKVIKKSIMSGTTFLQTFKVNICSRLMPVHNILVHDVLANSRDEHFAEIKNGQEIIKNDD